MGKFPTARASMLPSIWALGCVLLRQAQGSTDFSDKIYWTDAGHHVIRRANLDGSGVEDLIQRDDGTIPRGLVIDHLANKVYWAEMGTKLIMRANMDGTDVETVVETYRGPDALALDGVDGHLYWTDFEGRVQRMDLDGGFPEGLIEASFSHREGIAVDPENGWLYFACADKGYATIHKAHLDGSGVTHLIHPDDADELGIELFGPRGLALDTAGGKVYFSDTITDKIQRSNLDGSQVEDIVVSGLTSVVGLALDSAGGKLYWVDRGLSTLTSQGDSLTRANLDGSDIEVLVSSGHFEPRSIALSLAL